MEEINRKLSELKINVCFHYQRIVNTQEECPELNEENENYLN